MMRHFEKFEDGIALKGLFHAVPCWKIIDASSYSSAVTVGNYWKTKFHREPPLEGRREEGGKMGGGREEEGKMGGGFFFAQVKVSRHNDGQSVGETRQ